MGDMLCRLCNKHEAEEGLPYCVRCDELHYDALCEKQDDKKRSKYYLPEEDEDERLD